MNLQQRLESYENSAVVARYAHDHRTTLGESKKRFEEMKQFLYRSAIADKPLRPTPEVDGMWHTFILFTREYQQFCKNVLGRFVHHVPDDPGPDTQDEQEQGFLVRLLTPFSFLRLKPAIVGRAACTTDQDGSQDDGGGSDDGYVPS